MRGCLFDLDGTLINSLEDMAASVNYALMERGYPVHTLEEYRYMVGSGVTLLCERALPPYARTPEQVRTLRQVFQAYYAEHGMDATRPYPGVNWMLQQLRALKMHMGVITNKPDQDAQRIVERTFGKGVFDVVIGQREGRPMKPDPSVAFEAIEGMGIQPAECAYFGDSGVDMQTAEAAGARGVGVLWGYRTADELLENGALALIKSPEELFTLIKRWAVTREADDIKARVRRMLDEPGVSYDWIEHQRVYTMEECHPIAEKLGAKIFKNLLLSNRQKTKFYLFLTDEEPFRTAVFSKRLGVSRVSFVNGDDMAQLLDIVPGSVSPLALINDTEHRVRLCIHKSILDWGRVGMHPGDSTATLAMNVDELLKLCEGPLGHDYDIVDMTEENS